MFSEVGTYAPVGLFNATHIISIVICFAFVVIFVYLSKKMTVQRFRFYLKVFAIIFTCLELFKIFWTWSYGNFTANAWVPLYYCSLFIYSLWCAGFGKGRLKDAGMSFLLVGGIIGGGVFLIMPTTSFQSYPIFHFQCIYSMLYHSTFVYCAIMVLVTKSLKIDKWMVLKYIFFLLPFMLTALIINLLAGSNLMFVGTPAGIPLDMLMTMYNYNNWLYRIFCMLVHLALGVLIFGVYQLCTFKARRLSKLVIQEDKNKHNTD